jgi:kynurenine formamidase
MHEEFLAAERATCTKLRRGDILFVRTGHARKRAEEGPWEAAVLKAGLHSTVMPLLHEREVAAIGWDGDGEAVPSNCEGVMYPIHTIGINAMGLHFIDCLNFEELSGVCMEENAWEFLCVIAPLRLGAGTASPVNPLAVF